MDLEDLDIFRCVVREGGITRAAMRLHRVPSNVTTRIKQLEERLGVPLFRRQGRRLALTDAGRALLGHAERLLQLANEVEQDIRSGAVRGTLRIGSLESTAGVRLPPVLSSFHARYPDVAIELQTATTGALLERLQAFEFEAAFVSEPFEKGRLSSRVVFVEELVLITATSDPPPRRPSDLDGRTLVAFPHGCSYRRRLTEWVAEAGVRRGPHARTRFLPRDRRVCGGGRRRGYRARTGARSDRGGRRGRAPPASSSAACQPHAPRVVR